jgi:uncharacterized protein
MARIYERLERINISFNRLGSISFVLVVTSILFIIAFSSNIILGFIKQNDHIFFELQSKEKSFVFIYIVPLIFAPVFETFLGQALPYYLLKKVSFISQKSSLILIASAIIFGLLHFYSLFYMIYAFLIGLVLMYAYMVRVKNHKNAFLLVAICHALLNLGIIIRNLL